MKILFLYDNAQPEYWNDGLRAALSLLETDHKIIYLNPARQPQQMYEADICLAWGGLTSRPAIEAQNFSGPKHLLLGGYAEPQQELEFDTIFYETDWSRQWVMTKPVKYKRLVKAFGINSDIYNSFGVRTAEKPWDYLSVGSFSAWKRHEKIIDKSGSRLVVGEVQKGNYAESINIIENLIRNGVAVSPMQQPKDLAKIYRSSKTVYIPATIFGGGERAVLEARSCGCNVEIEPDNEKLQELLDCDIPDHNRYYMDLKNNI